MTGPWDTMIDSGWSGNVYTRPMTTSIASAFYIQRCNTAELVELAFDAQRALTSMIERGVESDTEYNTIQQYKADIKAEIVRRAVASTR